MNMGNWLPIENAPTDGTLVWLYVAAKHGLPSFITSGAYDPMAGWCVDELREATLWKPITPMVDTGIDCNGPDVDKARHMEGGTA